MAVIVILFFLEEEALLNKLSWVCLSLVWLYSYGLDLEMCTSCVILPDIDVFTVWKKCEQF